MTANNLLTLLSHHIGRGNGLGVKAIAAQLDIDPRQVRVHVTDLRLGGHAVCGTPKHGYFIAQTGEELEETCRFIRARSMHGLVLESRMRKIPLPDLIGQLHLPT